ncbi:MAG: 30S ribosomal protein S16 [Aureispira sp.]|nr:30S ribosomal protein S16 [Aureispira sp.]
MSVKIRLQRKGRKKQPYYHIVIADSRAPRDGRFIEKIGMYNPLTVPATIEVDREKAFDWLMKGAQPTDTTRAILKLNGVYYKKHLQRGVAKGALTQEAADKLLQEWIDGKEAKIETRKAKTAEAAEARRRKIFGEAPARPVKEEEAPVVEEEVKEEEAPADADNTEATAETTEEKTTEE